MYQHLEALTDTCCVTAVCNSNSKLELPEGVDFRCAPIERHIAPFRDLWALWQLAKIFHELRPDLVHSITPKAGLLAMLSAYVFRVPNRIHVFTGQVWVTKHGITRWLLKTLDCLTARLSTQLLADSESQRQFLINEGIAAADRIMVLGNGSICGVDVTRFKPDTNARAKIRQIHQIPDDAVLILFVGRITRDKGVIDLANGFSLLSNEFPSLYIMFVGPDEEGLRPELDARLSSCLDRVRHVGMTNSPENHMAAADIFCLPSYREGFGSVVIEAGACGLPTLASRIYGITDAVEEGATGILHDAGDVEGIASGLRTLALDANLREKMGMAARNRAETLFSTQKVVSAQMSFYKNILGYPPD